MLAAVALTRVAVAQHANATVDQECWGMEDRSRPLNGSMTSNGGVVVEQIGRRGSERVVQKAFGDLRVCMVTRGFDGGAANAACWCSITPGFPLAVLQLDDRPSRWPFRSDRVILQTEMPNDVRTLDVRNGRVTYIVNGAVRPPNAAALAWRNNLLGLLDVTWDVVELRGRMNSLRGEVSAIQGERSALQRRGLDVDARVNRIEDEIRATDEPARTHDLEERRDEAVARLKRMLRSRE